MGRSVKRGFVVVIAVALLAVAGAGVAWRLAGPAIVEGRIVQAIEARGLTVGALTVEAVELDRAILTDIELDVAGGLVIGRVEARYRLGELIGDRRLEQLDLSGMRLDLMGLAGTSLESAGGGGTGASLPKLPVGRIVMRDGRITLGTPLGAAVLAVDLDATPDSEGGLTLLGEAMLRAEIGEARIPFRAAVAPSGAFDASVSPRAGTVSWHGATLAIDDGQVNLAGTLAGPERFDAGLAGEVELPGGAAVALSLGGQMSGDGGGFVVTAESVGGDARFVLNGDFADWQAASSSVGLSLRADLPLLAQLLALAGLEAPSAVGGAIDAGFTGAVRRLAVSGPAFDGRLRLAAAIRQEAPDIGSTVEFDVGVLAEQVGAGWSMQVAGPYALSGPPGRVSGDIDLSASAGRAGDGFAGRIAGPLRASGSLAGALEFAGATAELSSGFRADAGGWKIVPEDCMPITVDAMAILGRLTAPDGATGCLSALPDRPLLAFGATDRALALELGADPMAMLADTGAPDALPLQVALPSITVLADGLGNSGQTVAIGVSGAAVRVPDPGLGFEDIALTASALGAATPAINLRLDSAQVVSMQAPAWFAPLTLSGDAAMGENGLLEFQGALLGPEGVAAMMEGSHDPRSAEGRMTLRLDPIAFVPGERQPVDLAPALAEMPIGEVTGSIAGRARMAWGGGVTSSAELDLDQVTLAVSGVTIRSIDGRLSADSLFPVNLPDGQLLALGGADLGVSLEEGAVAFGISGGDHLSVQGMGFGLAGGSLAVEPFRTRFDDDERAFEVVIRGIDLALLSEQFPVPGLSLTGRFDGRVPVRLIGDTISLENGVLQSTEGGAIRYVPALPIGAGGEGGFALLLDAVRNFQYQALGATVNGKTGEDLEVAVRLEGSNPDLYDGFPVALNINLSGVMDEILRSGLSSLALGDEAGDLQRGE